MSGPYSANLPANLPRKPHLRRAIISAAIGSCLIAVLWYVAPDFDYQIAFYAAMIVGVICSLLTLYFLQRECQQRGQPWAVPVTTLVAVALFASLVKIRTLSGEMIPQFGWRFSSRVIPELKTMPAEPADSDKNDDASDIKKSSVDSQNNGVDIQATPVKAEIPTWSQFLGNDRNGVNQERTFAIVKSPNEVETLWDIGIGAGWASFAVADEIAVTLEQRDKLECVTAYRVSDGELLWIVQHEALHFDALGEGGPRSTPTIVGNRVYAQGATGTVWCLELATGTEIWRADLLEIAGWDQTQSEAAVTWGRSASPLIVDGLCVLPLGADAEQTARSLIAFDAASGEVRWKSGADQISYASPQLLTLGGVRQIVAVNENTISGHTIDSGAQLWQTDWPGQSNGAANCASVIPAGENTFLVGKGYGGGSALIEVNRQAFGEGFKVLDLWRSNRVMKTKFNHAVLRTGVAYGLSNGALQAIDIESGERLWEQSRRSRSGQGQVILAGDVLIVQEEMGDVLLVAAEPNEYRELVRLDALQHKTWNVPSLVGNVLLIRNAVQAMALRLPE